MIDGTAPHATPLERALIRLVRKTYEQPARLTPADLDAVRALVGDGALDYALVVAGFHFINRIADLLHADPEGLPAPLRRIEVLRRLGVWVGSRLLGRMDLAARGYDISYEEAAAQVSRAIGRPIGAELTPLRSRPKLVEALGLAIEERDSRSSLDRSALARVHATVERALPKSIDEAEGFHPRPPDPVDAFAFVGTRYAYRTTHAMIDALRHAGYDDLGILDLAIAVSDANQWARFHRLLDLTPELFYLPADASPLIAEPAVGAMSAR